MTILTVSNQKPMLDELEKELAALLPGAGIIKQTDALMAGKVAFNQKIDVVFAATVMKRMNGLQLIQFVRQEHPAVKSYLIGSEQELSELFFTVPGDATGCLIYPFAVNAVRDLWQNSGK